MLSAKKLQARRASRIRRKLREVSDRPRLSVFRSEKHIYAQIIDDSKGHTVASASSIQKALGLKSGADKAAAAVVGKKIAEIAVGLGLKEVKFDRSGYRYHGRVQALADAAREAGLSF